MTPLKILLERVREMAEFEEDDSCSMASHYLGARAENDRLLPILHAQNDLIGRLVEALAFYGSEDNWCRFKGGIRHDIINPVDVNDKELDEKLKVFAGNKARHTLTHARTVLEGLVDDAT